MCHFITVTLPADTDLKALRPVLRAHGMAFEPVENAWVQEQLPPDQCYLRATSSPCDCGTVLGSERRARAQAERQRRPFADGAGKRGGAPSSGPEPERSRRQPVRGPDAREWNRFLGALLEPGLPATVGLLLHWYEGTLENERISIRRGERIRIGGLTPELLGELEEDVLYEIGGS